MASALRDAFASADPKVEERRTGTGRAYLVSGRMVGQVDERSGAVRVRMWLADRDRTSFQRRPTFDEQSGWMVVVSDDDVDFVRELVPAACRAALEGRATPASGGRPSRSPAARPSGTTARTRK